MNKTTRVLFVSVTLGIAAMLAGCRTSEQPESIEEQLETKKKIDLFSKKNLAWINASKVKNRKAGIKYRKDGTIELGFKNTPEIHEHYTIMFKPISVKGFDYLLLDYKAIEGTRFTVDIWWDNGKMLRPVPSVKGAGKWTSIKIPVRGDMLRLGFGVKEDCVADENTRKACQVVVKPLIGVREGNVTFPILKLQEPIIIPEPKKCERLSKEFILGDNKKVSLGICLNQKESILKKAISKEIADEIETLIKCPKGSIQITDSKKSLKNVDTVIVLDLDNETGNISLPNKREGYVINFNTNGSQDVIILSGKDKAGLYWAWQTLKQMLKMKGGKLTVAACNIVDWPDFSYRSFGSYDLASVKKHMVLKPSVLYSPWWQGGIKARWNRPSEEYQNSIIEKTDFAVEHGINIAQWIQPFCKKKSIIISDDKQVERLFKTYEISLKRGNRVVIMGIDDGGRDDLSFKDEDRKVYNNDQLLSHAWLIKRVSDKILKAYPEAIVGVITKHYETSKGIKEHFDRIGISKKVVVLWTGRQCVTLDYPLDVVKQYEKGIGGRRFVIFDNTPGQMHGMYRGLTMFEKYGLGYKNLYGSNCIGIHAMAGLRRPLNSVLAYSIAEYMWNASRYDAEKARQRAIAKIAGNPAAVEPILCFAEQYIKIANKYPIDKSLGKKQKPFRHVLEEKELLRYSISHEEYVALQKQASEMAMTLQDISNISRNQNLLDELETYFVNMKAVLKYLHDNYIEPPLVAPADTFKFQLDQLPGGTWYKTYDYKCSPKKSVVIYGKQTPNNMINGTFKMEHVPVKDATLILEGQNCDKHIARIKVLLNGNTIFTGKTPFVKHGWAEKEFKVPSRFFKKGKNILQIRNLEDSSDFIDHWAMFSAVQLRF